MKSYSGPVFGGHQLEVDWNDREGKAFIKETRTLKAFSQPDGTLLIEFQSELKPLVDKIKLTGDRQHAGVQFRAAQEVADNQKKTRYLRPKGWDRLDPKKQYNDKKHMDLPWNAIQYDIGDQGYTVAYLSDPKNPGGAEFSERLYGRFGEFFHYELTKEKPLKVRYRWWIKDSRKVSRQDVDVRYSDLAQPVKVSLK